MQLYVGEEIGEEVNRQSLAVSLSASEGLMNNRTARSAILHKHFVLSLFGFFIANYVLHFRNVQSSVMSGLPLFT